MHTTNFFLPNKTHEQLTEALELKDYEITAHGSWYLLTVVKRFEAGVTVLLEVSDTDLLLKIGRMLGSIELTNKYKSTDDTEHRKDQGIDHQNTW